MVIYTNIQNEQLRQLVMASHSIQSLAEADIQSMVDRIAQLPVEGQKELIVALLEEQKTFAVAEKFAALSPEEKIAVIEENKRKIALITKKLDTEVLTIYEKHERNDADIIAENLLQSL